MKSGNSLQMDSKRIVVLNCAMLKGNSQIKIYNRSTLELESVSNYAWLKYC